MNSHLDEKTLNKRLKMAEGFYRKYFEGELVSAAVTREKLKAVSSDYRPDSWRNLRAALACFWFNKGEQDAAMEIRKTKRGRVKNALSNSKAKRCKRVTEEDWLRLFDQDSETLNPLAYAVLILGYTTGMRPLEMTMVEINGEDTFYITSSKKRDDRGLDREIKITDPLWAKRVRNAIEKTSNRTVGELQNAFAYLVEKTFPARQTRPTIYSMRHQFGSNLKASGMDRKMIAYLMGHRVTASVDKYGNRRSGSGGFCSYVQPAVYPETIDSLIIENHNNSFPPSEHIQPSIRSSL